MKRCNSRELGVTGGKVSTSELFVRILIFLNLPLWIAIAVLAFAFEQWQTVKILAGSNAALLLVGYFWNRKNWNRENRKNTPDY